MRTSDCRPRGGTSRSHSIEPDNQIRANNDKPHQNLPGLASTERTVVQPTPAPQVSIGEHSTVAIVTQTRRVRVWFGAQLVADYVADPPTAQRYAEAMGRRFAGLHVTSERALPPPPAGVGPLPSERLWELTP